jgi:uncharacterized membrane protein
VAAGIWQLIEISCTPALLLMLIRVFRPLHTHRSYRARKSAVAGVVVAVVAAGGGGFGGLPFRTTSAQEGESETGKSCGANCGRLAGDPAGRPAPTTLPVSRGAEP